MGTDFFAVTGAGSGIGLACVTELSRRGHDVFAFVFDEREAETLAASGPPNITARVLDVTEPDHIAEAAEAVAERARHDAFRGLVNSAGIVVAGPLEVLPDEDLRRQFDVNVFGLMAMTRALLPSLRDHRGRVVNIGSVGGRLSVPFTGAYSASKFAVRALSDALRMELRPSGVAVALVEPGPIKTPIWTRSKSAAEDLLRRLSGRARELYRDEITRVFAMTDATEARAIGVQAVVHAVVHALTAARPKAQYLVGREAHAQALLSRLPAVVRDPLLLRAMGLPARRR